MGKTWRYIPGVFLPQGMMGVKSNQASSLYKIHSYCNRSCNLPGPRGSFGSLPLICLISGNLSIFRMYRKMNRGLHGIPRVWMSDTGKEQNSLFI